MTAAGHKPSRDWLNFVVTSRARNKIKHYIHSEEKTRSLELGTRLFDKEARAVRAEPEETRPKRRRWTRCSANTGCEKADELYAAIGYGKLPAQTVLAQARAAGAAEGSARERRSRRSSRRVLGTGEDKIKVRGIDDLMVFRARCCNPIRGEQIIGYITRGKGVSVHSASLLERGQPPLRSRAADRRRVGQGGRPDALHRAPEHPGGGSEGILADVSSKIAGINTNIRNVEATVDDQMGRIDMTVEISDVKHLQKVVKALRSIAGVVDVERASR